jgi:PadR family transcriptional regulator, regulatory protein PadR
MEAYMYDTKEIGMEDTDFLAPQLRQDDDFKNTLSSLEEYILAALLGRQLYGLQIAQAIEAASQKKRTVSVGSLYPTLRRLEKKGFVSSSWDDNTERGGARRRYYRITGKGAAILTESITIRDNLMKMEWQPA